MRTRNEEEHQLKKTDIMEKCFDCYAEYGLNNAGIKTLAKACGCTSGSLYTYFENLDDLIIQSTAHCMSKVEEDFMRLAPTDTVSLMEYVDKIPYWTAKEHGKKYRLMYQIYTNPKYIEYGKQFFEGVNERYTKYAKMLESKILIPYEKTLPLIFILIRASVHYALFEDEYYLKAQLNVIKDGLKFYIDHYEDKFKDVL